MSRLLGDQKLVVRVQDAVQRLHGITANALIFGKLLYMSELDRLSAENGGVFDAGVASLVTASFPIDAGQMEEWIDAVSSRLEKRVGRPYAPAKMAAMQRLHTFYDDVAGRGLLPTAKLSSTNLSSPKGHAAAQLATNYRTNVHCHFDKYIRRWVRLCVTSAVLVEHGLDPRISAVPRLLRRALEADIRAVCNDLLQSPAQLSCREALRQWVTQQRPSLMPPPPAGATQHWRFISQKERPELWLPYMLVINRRLEAESARLLSPLPQRTSFVPSHIRLDTVGLIDLLVADGDETMLLMAQLEELDMPPSLSSSSSTENPIKYDLPGLLPPRKNCETPQASKAMLYVDLAKLVAPALADRVRQDPIGQGAAFKTSMWRCLTKLGSANNKDACLTFAELVFNNVIDTDGVSVSVHYVSPSLYGSTRFNGGFKAIKASQRTQAATEKAKGATYVTSLSEAERAALIERRGGRLLSCDPGKGVLAAVTDGEGRFVTYTAAQRRAESGAQRRARELRRLLDVRQAPGSPTAGELQRRIGVDPNQPDARAASSKSCEQSSYELYLRTRSSVWEELSAFYRRPLFRVQRYEAYVGRRSSEDRFASRITAAFGRVAAILYGDWGRSPNLKHQPPSPGVGLRRSLCSHFKVLLVHEAYTSSVCPCCQSHNLTKPRRDGSGADVHHLLKCPNHRCSRRWWNRDVLGSLNILKCGEHALRTGQWHPVFTAPTAA